MKYRFRLIDKGVVVGEQVREYDTDDPKLAWDDALDDMDRNHRVVHTTHGWR